jgi:hypothetical protein
MFYVKSVDGKNLPINEVAIYCNCPKCGKEVNASDLFFELYKEVEDFDEYSAL